ncbi:MAG: universal stress protein [Rhodobacteraceae bacterium]|nr:universal stress protein [Paracoccaceae bacterium]
MYRKILVPVALEHGNDHKAALDIARRLLAKGGEIVVLNVVEEVPSYIEQYLPRGQIEKNVTEARSLLQTEIGDAKGISVAVITGHAGNSITGYAEENGIDLIVIASHRPGLQDFFLGSTAARVVRHAAAAVHVMR